MHEEICSVELSKLAKEKGFPLKKVIKQDGRAFYYELPQSHPDWANCDAYYMPTQSLLQKWLREEKGIIIELKYSDSTESFRPFWSWQIYNTLGITLEIGEPNTTYEQALESALKYALKKLV